MARKEFLTLRQYAERLGTSHQTVSAAITAGKIVEGYDDKTQKVNPAIADLEWGYDFSQKQAMKQAAKAGKVGTNEGEPISNMDGDIPANTKTPELYRMKLYYETKKAQIAVREAEGKLIDKAEAYRQMYGWGQGLKNELTALPERILDDLLSTDRPNAKLIFEGEIHRILEIMAGYDNEFDTGIA